MPIALQKKSESRFPELAIARKGGKKRQKSRADGTTYEIMGEDLNYFRMDFHDDPFSQAAKFAFFNSYPSEPNNLRIYLPFHQIDRQWSAYYEGYRNGAMVVRAGTIPGEDPDVDFYITAIDHNGKRIVTNGYNQDGERVVFEPGNIIVQQRNQKPVSVKPVGRLYFVIPETIVSDVLGCVLLRTHSYNDIVNITSQLAALEELTNGKVSAIPLHLMRRDEMVPVKQKDGSIMRTTKSLVSIIANTAWAREFLTKRIAAGSEMANPQMLPHLSVMTGDTPPPDFGDEGDILESELVEGEIVFESDDNGEDERDFDAEVANIPITRNDARKMIINGKPAQEHTKDDLMNFIDSMQKLYEAGGFDNPDQERTATVQSAAAYLVIQEKNRN